MPLRFLQHTPRAMAAVGLSLSLVAASLWLLTPSGQTEPPLVRASYDASFAFASATELTNSPVVVVYLDLESHLREKQDPANAWDRALHAALVRRLTQAGARAVVFDVIFAEAGPNAAADREFADAIRANGRVSLAAELNDLRRHTGTAEGIAGLATLLPHEPLRRAAAGWGITSLPVDPDFSVRRHFAGHFANAQPSLAWNVARQLELPGARIEPPEPRWMRYYGPPLSVPHVSYSAALRSEETPDAFFQDRIVVIGARPVVSGFGERRDEFVNPFSPGGRDKLFLPGAEIHATQLLNLARGDWLRRGSPAAEAAALLLGALLLPAMLLRLRPAPGAFVAVGAELAVLATAVWAMRGAGLWFPWLILAVVQIPAAFFGALVFHSVGWYRQRRRLEAARREAEAKIREQAALIDKAQDAILVHDLNGRVLYANARAERIYGWSAVELTNGAAMALFDSLHPTLADARETVLKEGEWLGEIGQTTRSGQPLIVQSRWTLIRDDEGRAKSIFTINTDLTEKKRLEAQLLRSQRMETIGALAGGMAHDLNAALSPVLLGAQLLGRDEPDPERRRLLEVMEANTQRGAQMLRQVLTFARGTGGDRQIVQPGPLLREMERIARQTFPKNLTVAVLTPRDLWPVLANATELHQVLLNLCVNARDAMSRGGELSLSADNVTLSTTEAVDLPGARAGDFVMLLVADTGTGIVPEDLPRIFEPFFTTKPAETGTGLGLATVARIVSGHGGFVNLRSEVNVGTTFEVYLPRAEASSPPRPRLAEEPAELPQGRGELVLVATAERALGEMTASVLRAHGYAALVATDTPQVLAVLDRKCGTVRLALLDVALPETDGRPLFEAVRWKQSDLPVVLIGGTLTIKPSDAAPTTTPVGTLLKPFGAGKLVHTVAEALRR